MSAILLCQILLQIPSKRHLCRICQVRIQDDGNHVPFIILLVRQTVVAHDKTPVNFCVFISFCQNLAVILVRLVKDSVLLKPFCLMVEFLKFFQFVFGILSPESLQRLLMLICCLLQLPYFFTDLSLVLQKLSCR